MADTRVSIENMRMQIKRMPDKQRIELIGYLRTTGASDLAKELFSIDSLDIVAGAPVLYVPQEVRIYTGNHRDNGDLQLQKLSKKELKILLQAFFKNSNEKEYIIDMIFYQNGFLTKTHGDILEYLSKVEELFQKVWHPRKTVLKIVQTKQLTNLVESANDTNYRPLVERIEGMEPGYLNYIHETYLMRLQYVESIFCGIIMSLAGNPKNHVWALDPEHMKIDILPPIQDKITLIKSICEFHRIIDPNFPLLHTLIESTLASWILIYRWFSAPVERVRDILGWS